MSLKHRKINIDSLFPVNLILKNKKCIIIGGGKVATHKAEKLISSGVNPTIISYNFSKRIIDLEKQNLVSIKNRFYKDSDLNGAFLVFIATNDLKLNLHIIDSCKSNNILFCSVDQNWHKSTFITPASFTENGLAISISTGGKSCRYARLVKENIKKCITNSEESELLLIGTDNRYLPLTEREALHISINNSDIPKMLSLIVGIHEFMIINTCNRIEIFSLAKQDNNIEKVILKLINFDTLQKNKYYVKHGHEAFKHLTLVTSGIHSQLIGENHITSQVKEAFSLSEKKQWSGGILKSSVESALYISKKIRNSISSTIKPIEIEDLTLKYLLSLKKTSLKKEIVAVIGTGKIGSQLIEELLKHDSEDIYWFYHTNIPKVPRNTNIKIMPLSELATMLQQLDIIITALSIDEPILTHKHSTSKNLTIIDLGIPRNISLDFSSKIIDIEKLKYWFRKEICSINTVLPICEQIINDDIKNYEKIFSSLKDWNKK